jgi:hypothetical protein
MTSRLILIGSGLLLSVGGASAESHPAWWRYASPEATALVGMRWEHLRSSPFADAISGELHGDDGLGFPDLDCLKEARQILVSSPVLLAMATGDFPTAAFQNQAAAKGLKRAIHHEVEIWVTPGKETLSVARMSDHLVLLGHFKDLQNAIDRSLVDEADRSYSPLLARAARYAQDDLWVVSASLPDELADRFIPIDTEAEGFEGGVSLDAGLTLKATFLSSSDEGANQLVETLKQTLMSMPLGTRGIEIRIDQNDVILSMALTGQQLVAGLKPAAAVVTKAEPQPEPGVAAKPAVPQVIRIYGLDEGTREIVVR